LVVGPGSRRHRGWDRRLAVGGRRCRSGRLDRLRIAGIGLGRCRSCRGRAGLIFFVRLEELVHIRHIRLVRRDYLIDEPVLCALGGLDAVGRGSRREGRDVRDGCDGGFGQPDELVLVVIVFRR
jgi:hypothetical protein